MMDKREIKDYEVIEDQLVKLEDQEKLVHMEVKEREV
jgi:hypothetical protein